MIFPVALSQEERRISWLPEVVSALCILVEKAG
jgi:hypothetical protein